MKNFQLQKSKEKSPSKVILIGEGAKILKYERGESYGKNKKIWKNNKWE